MDLKDQTSLECPNEFPFPFPPYEIQRNFMRNLFHVLEDGKLGIFESPTGTGKSLSIICGVLRWLYDRETHDKTSLLALINALEKQLKIDDDSEDWFSSQARNAEIMNRKNGLQYELKAMTDREEEIKNIKKNVDKRSRESNLVKTNKVHAFSNYENSNDSREDDENDELLEDFSDDEEKKCSDEEAETKYDSIKVYFCSRTHSQLSQFISEVRRSPYGDVRMVPLASRQNFCVNSKVKNLKNLSLINEKCLELQKNKTSKTTKTDLSNRTIKKLKGSSGCSFNNCNSINYLKEHIVSQVCDIEELVSKGEQMMACPYYATRAAVPLSQLIVVPYNTLLHKSTRKSSKINLKNNIVIIDEAHNLLDAIGNMHSVQVTGNQLCLCMNQLNAYKAKYEKRFSPFNLLHLSQLSFVVKQLVLIIGGSTNFDPSECSRYGVDTKIYTQVNFLQAAEIDNYNLYKLLDFCRRSKISRKLQGFTSKNPTRVLVKNKNSENGLQAFLENIHKGKNAKVTKSEAEEIPAAVSAINSPEFSNNPILFVISFLESLTNDCEDGRIICTRQSTVGQGSLKFLLLNPASHFHDIVQEARSIVVCGGTMQPISEFRQQLFINAGADESRISTFSCGHVIPAENILPIVLHQGPTGKLLDYSYQTRNTTVLMNELGRLLDNVCNVVPAGIVCFFPSYEYELNVFQHLENCGIIEKLSRKKKLFREPKKSSDVDVTLAEFRRHIEDAKQHPGRKPNGCLLFSVIGGKLSEGLNFSDDLGRCVIVVGLPYPNIKSAELREKMAYLDKTAGPESGKKYYENLCTKAVNQSIGRAVRHRNDYATILLVDHRYARDNIRAALPSWMMSSLLVCEKFGPALGTLAKEDELRVLEENIRKEKLVIAHR